MTTATARKATRNEHEASFFQGKIGSTDFKANFVTHTLRQGYWLLEGAQRGSRRARRARTARTVVIFKYLFDREDLPSGRYVLTQGQDEDRFSLIIMQLDDSGVPAYTAIKGTVEFFHDEDNNHVNGAVDVSYRDVHGFEVQVQMLFSN